jgi:hypothetical protein
MYMYTFVTRLYEQKYQPTQIFQATTELALIRSQNFLMAFRDSQLQSQMIVQLVI